MKIVVDAYNVLHQVITGRHISDQDRKWFINKLAAYAKKKKHTIIVVFDGGPFLFPTTYQQQDIVIKYSGPKDSADDIILRYIKEHAGHSLILVSSDRQLCQAARFYNVEAMGSGDFYEIMVPPCEQKMQASHIQEQAVKTGQGSSCVDELMMQTRVYKKIEDLEDPLEQNRVGKSKTLPKKQRKRMLKIKKL